MTLPVWSRSALGSAVVIGGAAAVVLVACASVEDRVSTVRTGEPNQRIKAMTTLADGVDRERPAYLTQRDAIVAAVEEALDHPSALVRQVAVEALGVVAGADAAGPIVDRLRDQDPWVRYAAARVLGKLEILNAREPLERVLDRDPHVDVRRQAAEALRRIGSPESLEAFYLGLGDAASAVRHECMLGLRALTGKDYGPDPRAWRAVLPR